MEASAKVMEMELVDPFEREVDEGLPEGEDRASAMLRVDWLLQRIREESGRAEEVGQFTARRILMVQDHGKEELRKIEGRIAHLESRLRMHVPQTGEGMQKEFGKRSLNLPHGTVGYRAVPTGVRISDMKAVVAWAKESGAVPVVTHVEEKVAFLDLKKYVADTGEIPEGTEYVEASEKFYVTPAKGDA